MTWAQKIGPIGPKTPSNGRKCGYENGIEPLYSSVLKSNIIVQFLIILQLMYIFERECVGVCVCVFVCMRARARERERERASG